MTGVFTGWRGSVIKDLRDPQPLLVGEGHGELEKIDPGNGGS